MPSHARRSGLGTLVVGQSGGATAVINASLVGVLEEARAAGFARVLGMRRGIEGLLAGDLLDLRQLSAGTLARLRQTPSAALGTGRHKLRDDELESALAVLRRHDVQALVYIGGNDSADTAHRLHWHAAATGYDLRVIGVPKTIDNDLPETDHCPGYGSIARFLGNAVRDATYDTLASPQLYPVKFVEVMGRDAGWVAAAGALGFAAADAELAPLLYVPERPPRDVEQVLAEVAARVEIAGCAVAVVPETLHDAAGRHLGGERPEYVDAFGHAYYPPVGATLTRLALERLGLRARCDKPGTIARMSAALASAVDRDEAYLLGRAAVARAVAGDSDLMVTLVRVSDRPYRCEIRSAPLAAIANRARPIPLAFLDAAGRGITDAFRAYALPLLGPDPFLPYARL